LLYDGTTHNFSFTALTLGIGNPFKLTSDDFRRVVEKLVALRDTEPLFYSSPDDGAKAFIENKVALMYGNFGTQQVKKFKDMGIPVGYVIPEEGALAWLDCWALSNGATNKTMVENWINFTLSAPIAAALTQRQALANTLTKAAIKANDKILWLESVEDAEKRTRLWDRIRKDKARQKQY
jgi:putative spermidine/putrescine transport system substrate-binding protein